jgi:predicted dehydrogenase
MCTNVADAQGLVAAASSCGLGLLINQLIQFSQCNFAAADRARRGVLRRTSDAVFHMEFDLVVDPASSKMWRNTDAAERGGPIGDITNHCFYTMEFVLGSRITALAAIYSPKTSSSAVEDGALIRVTLASHGRGMLPNMGYSVDGEKGVLRSYGILLQSTEHLGNNVQIRIELDDFT